MSVKNRRGQPPWWVFPGFLCLNLLLRSSSFLYSIIDTDESVYLLMGQSILKGAVPYTAVWDHKPPCLYLLFAIAQALFGESVMAIRLLACLFVTLTCYSLYRLGSVVDLRHPQTGYLAGCLYAFFSLTNGGLATNAEILFAPLVVAAMWVLFSGWSSVTEPQQPTGRSVFLAGILLGMAIQIKAVVLFDATAVGLILLYGRLLIFEPSASTVRFEIKRPALLLLGIAIPVVTTAATFIVLGHAHEYVYSNFTANGLYNADLGFSLAHYLRELTTQLLSRNSLLWLCMPLVPLMLSRHESSAPGTRRNTTFLLIWLACTFGGIIVTRRFYPHYFLQLLPPLCMLSAMGIFRLLEDAASKASIRKALLILILAPSLFSVTYRPFMDDVEFLVQSARGETGWHDDPTQVADYLKDKVTKQDYIFLADYEPIVYYLVGARIPTKFVHPAWLYSPEFAKFIGTDPIQELQAILDKRPVYIVVQSEQDLQQQALPFYRGLGERLRRDYTSDRRVKGIHLYKLKADVGNSR